MHLATVKWSGLDTQVLPEATDFGWGQVQNYKQWPPGQVLQFSSFQI